MSAQLKRSLTLYGLTMVAIGGTIGSGIFRTPGRIADAVHLPEYVIALWILGGLVALTGALTFAEMGSMFPGAGGLYVYLREAYGDAVAFLYGWFILLISTSGAIAALALVCSEHILYLFGYGSGSGLAMPLAVGIVVFLSAVNILGVNVGEWIANIFTGAKLAGLLLIILAGVFFANPMAASTNAHTTFAHTPPPDLWGAFALGFVGVLWSVGGWHHASYMAGETENPQRNVPRAMMLGAAVVTLVYVLANVAYMRLLPIESIAKSSTVAADAMSTVHRSFGNLMAVLIALSTFGSTGIYCMTAPRIYYAMANDGIFFKKLADVHPKYRTPMNAILVQSGWSVLLLLAWGTFEAMVDYVTFIDFAGQVLVAMTIFTFRRSRPDAPRSYRTWGYPITPLVFIGICTWFIVFTLWRDSVQAWAGIAVVALGLPMYHYFATPAGAKHRVAFMGIFGAAVLAVAVFFKMGLPLRFLITAPILAGVFSAMLFLWKGEKEGKAAEPGSQD